MPDQQLNCAYLNDFSPDSAPIETEMARKVKGKSRAPVVATQRHKDIRGEIEPRLNQLIKLYESTDPALGKDAEFDKLENARTAIEIWWYVYADLMLWAQSHLA